MEWEALLEDACPMCGGMLDLAVGDDGKVKCLECAFTITDERRRQLVEKMKDERDGDEFYKQGR